MKIIFLTLSLGAMVSCTSVIAQVVTKDSIQMLENQKDAIELSKDVNDKKTQLAKLQNNLNKKNSEVQELAQKADQSAKENQQAASRLSANAQDKKLANQAKSAARKAERDAKSARKAADNQKDMQEQIAKIQGEISESESKMASMSVATASSAGVSSAAAPSAAASNIPAGSQPQTSVSPQRQQNPQLQQNMSPQPATVISNPVNVPYNSSVQGVADRVVESTYRNYPQQPGQPSIIINNIIIPSENSRTQSPNSTSQTDANYSDDKRSSDKKYDQDYADFLRWKREGAHGQVDMPRNKQYGQNNNAEQESSKMGFKERFGEMPKRKSGLWVIPLVGIHASGLEADFADSEAEGRTGWNAGLDFRFHAKRFFIQPGVHYFNSSLRLTSKDSLSSAPLLDGPRIHSLKVPVMLGVYLTKANSGFFKFNIKGGATGNYVLAVDKDAQSIFQKDDIEEYSYGLAAGVGLEFGLITLDLSHEWGMSSFLKNSDLKNNVLRATIGLKL